MIRFYNSITQKKEDFLPITKGKVKLYTCGPTVYDNAHIGNFRTFLFEDFLGNILLSWTKATENNQEASFEFLDKVPKRFINLKLIQN